MHWHAGGVAPSFDHTAHHHKRFPVQRKAENHLLVRATQPGIPQMLPVAGDRRRIDFDGGRDSIGEVIITLTSLIILDGCFSCRTRARRLLVLLKAFWWREA